MLTPSYLTAINHLSKLLFVALLASSAVLYAQPKPIQPQPTFKQFTVDEGLPSNEVYHIIQDSVGYIWVATANGVSRFDGKTFKNYGLDDGLVESSIHEIYPDHKGRLWFISNSGRLAIMENNQIVAFPFNSRLNEFIPKSRGTVKRSFWVDSLDNVHMSFKSFGRITISPEGVVTLLEGIHKEHEIVTELSPNRPILTSHNRPPSPNAYIKVLTPKGNITIPNTKQRSTFHFFAIEENSNSVLFSHGGRIFRLTNQQLTYYKDFGMEIIWLSRDKENNIWLAPTEGGIHLIQNSEFEGGQNKFILEGHQVTSLIQDNELGYWFSTLANGIFYCPNINLLSYNELTGLPSNRINTAFVNREGIFVGDDYGNVSHIKNSRISICTINNDTLGPQPIRFLGIDSTQSVVWVGNNYFLYSMQKGKLTKHHYSSTISTSFPRQMAHSNDGGYWIASSWGIRKFINNKFVYSSRELDEFSGVVYSVLQDSTGEVWMATPNGIWKYCNNQFIYLGNDNHYFSHTASHIDLYNKKTILIATKGIGLILYNDGDITRIAENDGIASNYINKTFVQGKDVWLATNNGVSWVRGNLEGEFTVQNINTSYGLPTNEVNNVFVNGDHVLISTTKGLTWLHKGQLKRNTVKPTTRITALRVSGMEISLDTTHINLAFDQNFISIDYIGLAYKNMGKVEYKYRLVGLDSSWVFTNASNSTYSGLPYGKYTFEVQAENSDGVWGNSAKLSFVIKPPFWQTYWFVILLTIVFTLIIYLIYKNRISAVKRRNELINNLNIYKQKSLRQQMNPHFIFNTLNSIQLYILEKDHISSHKYLTKFAKLMRLVLDNSQQSSIPLEKEIEALKLYLELESIRLSGKFKYSIEVESDELLGFKVPTLLIQPFVENSIWHGIMLKPEPDGWVNITVKNFKDYMLCTIEDNGVGRKAAQEIRSKQDPERKSLGFKITAQRIDLLNSLYKEKFSITYNDVVDSNGEPCGTRVEIKIPHTLKDDLNTK